MIVAAIALVLVIVLVGMTAVFVVSGGTWDV
jgi:hypothetical protein